MRVEIKWMDGHDKGSYISDHGYLKVLEQPRERDARGRLALAGRLRRRARVEERTRALVQQQVALHARVDAHRHGRAATELGRRETVRIAEVGEHVAPPLDKLGIQQNDMFQEHWRTDVLEIL